ncbi:aldo-keto reductase family 1 member B1 [Drosophila obscura]|uniref:aldo-keto reductase family 1 member B1 n=1 Tax=Drosophila obscura TaxID=7282 RepID=UPI001BB298DE|nr:aldo-keto reductase family 1 member B1 [Drosophila obscura]XP_041449181.1 aldo-keto reductase family 1 member B1 [Drosophila obscura]
MTNLAPKIKLNNGQEMPVLGLGTWKSFESEAYQATCSAIDIGYRHFDTAFVYENETEVGQAVREKIAAGVIKREDIFVTTKLGGIHHDPELVERAFRLSLNNLGLEYIDMYLMHLPIGQKFHNDSNVHGTLELTDVDYLDTWREMEKLVDLGLARSIGLSNFNAAQTERVLANCRIKPVVNQVECHPGFQQQKLRAHAKQHGLVICAYCPLARPQPARQWPAFIYDDQAQRLAKKYGRSTAQICLRYLIQIGVVPLPKSSNKTRIEENFKVFDFELSPEDVKAMEGYETGQRTVPFSGMSGHKYYPFNDEF